MEENQFKTFTGIDVFSGGKIDAVQVGNRIWPVTPTNVLSLLFFKVRNVAYDSMRDIYYLSPEHYYGALRTPPVKEDYPPTEEGFDNLAYDNALAQYIEDKQMFLEDNKGWVDRKNEILQNPEVFIEDHRKKLGRKGFYKAAGWPISNTEECRVWRF